MFNASTAQPGQTFSGQSMTRAKRVITFVLAGDADQVSSAAADASASDVPIANPANEAARQRDIGILASYRGCSISFCTRQLRSSATYSTFSDGHAISWIQPNCFSCLPDSPSTPSTLPSSESLYTRPGYASDA